MNNKMRLIKEAAGMALLSGFLVAQSFLILLGISMLFSEISLLSKALVLWLMAGTVGSVYLAGAFIKREYGR